MTKDNRGIQLGITVPKATADSAVVMQREAEEDAADLHAIVVDSDAAYTAADALLTLVVQRKDAAINMRKSATVPLYGVIRTVESWFKPTVDALTLIEKTIEERMGAWRLELAERERVARLAAADAATAGDGEAMIESLTVAAELAEAPVGRATVGFKWVVESVDPAQLPDEFWTPNVMAIQLVATNAGSSEVAPEIPGVVFKRVTAVRARR